MTESERTSRNAVQEAMDRRDNGGPTGHEPHPPPHDHEGSARL
jgi:hypothetical protein